MSSTSPSVSTYPSSDRGWTPAHRVQGLVGTAALLIGLLFYLAGRPQQPALLALWGDAPGTALAYSWFTGSLPSLLHSCAFTALSAVCTTALRLGLWRSAWVWCTVNVAWEFLGGALTSGALRPWLGAAVNDPMDSLFALAGAFLPILIHHLTTNPQHP